MSMARCFSKVVESLVSDLLDDICLGTNQVYNFDVTRNEGCEVQVISIDVRYCKEIKKHRI
jgi:hypothetical protein